jgi:predicted amidophosphoribosyltransferase
MAYLTCPDCMMPTSVGDDAVKGVCQSCFAEIVFERCPVCGFYQAIPSRWQNAFTCGRCEEKVDIPRTRLYRTSTKARTVEGYGYSYPRF